MAQVTRMKDLDLTPFFEAAADETGGREDEGVLDRVASLGARALDQKRPPARTPPARTPPVLDRPPVLEDEEGDQNTAFPGPGEWDDPTGPRRGGRVKKHTYSDAEYQRVLEAWRLLGAVGEIAEQLELSPDVVERYFREPPPKGVTAKRSVDRQAAHEDKIAIEEATKIEAAKRIEAKRKIEEEQRQRDEALGLEGTLIEGVRKSAAGNMRSVLKAAPGVHALAQVVEDSLIDIAKNGGKLTTLPEIMTAVRILNTYAQASYRTALLVREGVEVRLLREAAPIPEAVALEALAVTGQEAARLVATANRALERATRLQAGGQALEMLEGDDGVFSVRTGDPEART